MELPPQTLTEMLRIMLLSRRLDEQAWSLYRQGKASYHLSAIGHEAAQVAAGLALQRGRDWAAPYYRDLALLLALGLQPLEYLRMLLGRKSRVGADGRAMPGSWNLKEAHVLSTSGLAANHVLHAVGIAQAIRYKREEQVVLASCGEGATSQGEWYEALNWAAVQRLPVVFLVQNNGIALSTRQAQQMAARSVLQKAQGLGLPGRRVDGLDPVQVYRAVSNAAADVRAGGGPALVEALVLRIPPHSSDDDDRTYRTRSEVDEARRQDPLRTFRRSLLQAGHLAQEQVEQMEAGVNAQVEQALQEAEQTPFPAPEEAAGRLYAQEGADG